MRFVKHLSLWQPKQDWLFQETCSIECVENTIARRFQDWSELTLRSKQTCSIRILTLRFLPTSTGYLPTNMRTAVVPSKMNDSNSADSGLPAAAENGVEVGVFCRAVRRAAVLDRESDANCCF